MSLVDPSILTQQTFSWLCPWLIHHYLRNRRTSQAVCPWLVHQYLRNRRPFDGFVSMVDPSLLTQQKNFQWLCIHGWSINTYTTEELSIALYQWLIHQYLRSRRIFRCFVSMVDAAVLTQEKNFPWLWINGRSTDNFAREELSMALYQW